MPASTPSEAPPGQAVSGPVRPRWATVRAGNRWAARILRGLVGAAARDFDAGAYLQDFLVAAVVTILATRLFLGLTGFPQLGGGGLHVAHLLWGGLFMLVALVLLLAVLGKRTKRLAALIGGLGFGLFIDELGKFITEDNDYFYRPTVALVYIIFILLFLLSRWIGRRRALSEQELLVNAADLVKEVILDKASREEIARALALLERSGTRGAVADGIRTAVLGAARAPERGPSLPTRAAALARRAYDRLVAQPWFRWLIVVTFVADAVVGVLTALAVVAAIGAAGGPILAELDRSRVALGGLVASLASSALVVIGVARLMASRLAAFRWFERSVLVSIFFTQVFLFWQNQLAALGGLAWDIALLVGVSYGIREEVAWREAASIGDGASRSVLPDERATAPAAP